MLRKKIIAFVCTVFFLLGIFQSISAIAFVKGIYITAWTAQNSKRMDSLIARAKKTGINTFVIDVYNRSKIYTKNIQKVREAGITYVARVVMFPDGARGAEIKNRKTWEKRWAWAQYAISIGASEIQLDYIRYHRSTPKSHQNEHNVHEVIKYFQNKLKGTGIKLQIDIFGVAALRGPSRHIGQNATLFAPSIDAINPMVYPSHYEPYRYYSERPYETVFSSVTALKQQLSAYPYVKIYAYVEMFNYRYPMSSSAKAKYIQAQIQGAVNAKADGWYAWSANNRYNTLFSVLGNQNHIKKD